ncbi:hypothetical protein Golax_009108 [Gossypium laxum]|uniref:DUF4283 domain-containing protein n=1 Tax=Gossypium laxum TaxID=34288 RepID=A0A7J9ADK6_9ROSI|nr:hypothetical protein [Gossypium laxum]
MAWIRLSRLSRFMCKRRMLEAIEGMVVKIAKLDFNTDSRTMGRFARMAVFINLDGPLVSQVLVNSETPWVEYRALRTICFSCVNQEKLQSVPEKCLKRRTGRGCQWSKNHDEVGAIHEASSTGDSGIILNKPLDLGAHGSQSNRPVGKWATPAVQPKPELDGECFHASNQHVKKISTLPTADVFTPGIETPKQASKFDEIKAHLNPTFVGPEGVEVYLCKALKIGLGKFIRFRVKIRS